jgi:hypothetical protein
MASSKTAGLASAMTVAALVVTLTTALPVAAQSEQTITICQATGSTTNPWVFTTIDARDLPEHLARGDFRATSIGECSASQAGQAAAPAPAPTASPTPTAAPARPAVQQQGLTGGVPLPGRSASQLVGGATATPPPGAAVGTANPTAAPARVTGTPAVNVAGAQTTSETEVSALPRSGGEPDRPLLALGLLGLIGLGWGLRRLARVRG